MGGPPPPGTGLWKVIHTSQAETAALSRDFLQLRFSELRGVRRIHAPSDALSSTPLRERHLRDREAGYVCVVTRPDDGMTDRVHDRA
jgi:hypothetical protein